LYSSIHDIPKEIAMKKLIVLSVAAALTMSTQTVLAADPSASTSPKAQATTSDLAEFDKQMAQMQQNMKAMQEQMDKIRQTQDPQARQQLLQEHWTTMQNNMQLMHGMWGSGMGNCCSGGQRMGHGMMGDQMWGDYRRLTPEQARQRQYMTDRFMPMQQMMMDHMMQQQQWMWKQPK
jgi:hypothetical protein